MRIFELVLAIDVFCIKGNKLFIKFYYVTLVIEFFILSLSDFTWIFMSCLFSPFNKISNSILLSDASTTTKSKRIIDQFSLHCQE